MGSNERLHYFLNDEALDFPYVGMLESTEPISYFDPNSIPSAVLKAKECLEGRAEDEYSILDNSYFADHRIDLTKIELTPGCNAYFFFEITCDKDTDSFFYIHTSLNIRIWHNEQFFSISRSRTGVAFTIQLKKGSNRICLEYPKAKRGYVLSFWINSFENESNNDYLSVLDGTANRLHPFTVYAISRFDPNRFHIDVLPLPADKLGYKGDATIELITFPAMEKVAIFQLPLYKPGHWEASLSSTLVDVDFIRMRCSHTVAGANYEIYFDFPTKSNQEYYTLLLKDIQRLRPLCFKNATAYSVVGYWAWELSMIKEDSGDAFRLYTESRVSFDWIERGAPIEELFTPGNHKVFFNSKLDGMPISYLIRIPQRYDDTKKYPLVALFSTNRYDDYSTKITDTSGIEEFLCADITGRGITTGSYIGEASINEVLEHIQKTFSVDTKRIYGAGHSNGAYATWIQAQLHPDRFAGIFPSSGAPNWEMLNNLVNMRVFSITSTMDAKAIQESHAAIRKAFSTNPKYTSLIADKHTHATIEFAYRTKSILADAFTYRQDPYPIEIDFTTIRNRTNKAYWIEIHSIVPGEVLGRIKAKIDGSSITIQASGITGFSMEIPPTINKKSFNVVVNDSEFIYSNETRTAIHYSLAYGKAEEVENKPICKALYKGDGLLNVYLAPMSVCFPQSQKDSLERYAFRFSHPKSNGRDDKIYVRYPIHPIEESAPLTISQRNIVFLDLNDNCAAGQSLRKIAPIQTSDKGYSYNGIAYEGDYCVMQIFANPEDPLHSILYINANTLEAYKKNFFVRKVILNSYMNGFHPYYNNAALIWKNGKYYAILDYGCPEVEIKNASMSSINQTMDIL